MESLIGWFIPLLAFAVPFLLNQFIYWLFNRHSMGRYWETPDSDNFIIYQVLSTIVIGFITICLFTEVIGRQEEKTVKTINIESFNDKFYVTGNFSIGSGEVKEELKYNVYLPLNDGSIKLFSMNSDNVSIRYTNTVPQLYVVRTETWTKYFPKLRKSSEKYTLFVPKGSIKTTGLDGE